MESIFPASYSTLLPSALADLVSRKYGWAAVRCEFLVRGVGDTYLIESGDNRYILRVYRSSHRNRVQIGAEVHLLLALQRAEVPVSFPIPDHTGEYIQAIHAAEGQRYAVLFSYAAGRSVAILSEAQLSQLGRQMARFHQISAGLKLPGDQGSSAASGSPAAPGSSASRWTFDLQTTLFGPLARLKPYFVEDPAGYAWFEQAVETVVMKLSQLDVSTFSTGYCHFDFLPKNFHFDGDAVTFFDFDFMGRGWLVNDIMTFWQNMTVDVRFGRMTSEAADHAYAHFLAAYRTIRSISEEELEAVPYLTLGFWLFYSDFHTTHDAFYGFVQPGHLKIRVRFIQQLMQKYWPDPFPAPAMPE
jgi:Ser/Thr protein kinase RdoA (MazF antagonist)